MFPLCYSCTHQHILPALQHWAVPFFSWMVSLCRGYLEVDFSPQYAQYVRLSVSLPAAGASASYIALLSCRSVTELRLHHCPRVLMWHSLLHPHIHTQPVPPRVLPTLGWSWHVCVTEQRWRWALRSYQMLMLSVLKIAWTSHVHSCKHKDIRNLESAKSLSPPSALFYQFSLICLFSNFTSCLCV